MKKLIIGLIGLGVIAVVAVGAFYIYETTGSDDPNLATSAPAIPTATTVATTASSAGATPAVAPSPAPTTAIATTGTHHFVIDSAQSSAKFIVKETLRGVPDVTAVGQTSAITGDLFLTNQGLAAASKSSFKVDLTKLATDSGQRDNFIKRNTLETSRYPTAEFTVDSVAGFPMAYKEGDEAQVTLNGMMTIHGVSKPLTWQAKVRQAGNVLTATADSSIKMTDFGMSPPDVGVAKAQNDVQLQVVFVANRSIG